MMEKEEFNDPYWCSGGKVHNWKNYVSDEVKRIWHTFDVIQRKALAENFDEIADKEEWE